VGRLLSLYGASLFRRSYQESFQWS